MSESALWAWIDDLSRSALGVGGSDFVDLYQRGVYWDKAIAHDIASVFPLLSLPTNGRTNARPSQ